MQIGAFSQAHTSYSAYTHLGRDEPENVLPEEPETSDGVGKGDSKDFDGNPYYDDQKHSEGSLPLLGYRRDGLLESGFGSDSSQGLNGLGESLNETLDRGPLAAGADPISRDDRMAAFRERDREVRAHERAHLSAAAGLARGGMQLSYQVGPDGRAYAVGGSVQIDTSEGATPQETLVKAARIEAAAMAPAEPSPQDLKVAAQARRMATEARQEIAEEQREAQIPVVEGSSPRGSDSRADVISRVYGAAVSADPAEKAFQAVA